MPYQTIEQINHRGYEKISMFLTVQHLFGIAACVIPGLAISEAVGSLVLRAIILLLLAALGYVLTSEIDGMAPYQRLLWRLRGAARALLRGRTIAPDDLPGTVAHAQIPIDWSGARVRRKPAPAIPGFAPVPAARPHPDAAPAHPLTPIGAALADHHAGD